MKHKMNELQKIKMDELAVSNEEFFALETPRKLALLSTIQNAIDTITTTAQGWRAETILSKIGKDREKVLKKLIGEVVQHMHKALKGVKVNPDQPLKATEHLATKAEGASNMPIKIMADATSIKSGYDKVKTEDTELFKSCPMSYWNNSANRLAQELIQKVWNDADLDSRHAWLNGNTPAEQAKIDKEEKERLEAEDLALAELKVKASKGDEDARKELEQIDAIEAHKPVIEPDPDSKKKKERNPKKRSTDSVVQGIDDELNPTKEKYITAINDVEPAKFAGKPPSNFKLANALVSGVADSPMSDTEKKAFALAVYTMLCEV